MRLGETDKPNHPAAQLNWMRDTPRKMQARMANGPLPSSVQQNCGLHPCPYPAYRRGLCRRHYRRWLRYRDPGPVGMIGSRAPLEERFANKVQAYGPIPSHAPSLGRCSIWTGYRHHSGFGAIWRGHSLIYVHRLAYEWAYGPIPIGGLIVQRCRNRLCVRADHLELILRRRRKR
jgi:hypothetical protein